MLNKKEIKYIQSLAHKKYRDERGVFVAEGPKIIAEFLHLIPHQFENIYATEEWVMANSNVAKEVAVQLVSAEELQKISGLQTANEVLAIVKQFPEKEGENNTGFTLYLDAIQDPGNFGTIIRLGDWFGVHRIICSPGCADVYNPKVVQSTMASIARVPVWYDTDMSWLHMQTGVIIAATLEGNSVYEHQKISTGILLLGNESKGIRPELVALATEQLTIPKRGNAESLNVAVATGIIVSHLLS